MIYTMGGNYIHIEGWKYASRIGENVFLNLCIPKRRNLQNEPATCIEIVFLCHAVLSRQTINIVTYEAQHHIEESMRSLTINCNLLIRLHIQTSVSVVDPLIATA